ncbi:uncharacterized protein LOC134672628 isoform X1 [Cydia fagiglandana]|uniref:uncharacterized protein LOC134672628 isoform X1 n=1 Tax=Cydia fagiglandana TaxID=1458189 RepID=UPI002FEE3968
MCRKYSQIVEFEMNGMPPDSRVIRGCGWDESSYKVSIDSLRKECSCKDTMCRKISQIVEFEMNGMPPDSRVIRGCGWDESSYKGRCYQRSGFGGRQEVCSCLEDGCNSATAPVAATLLMLLTAAVLRF